ncbi:MAG TPA: [Fe-Fe] hydrogenase large subunit C-terminal domain-containing protein, partial [Elusimicrobiales bacterium]|nr:[Fe-Fe] hydrogenase large subunit C-terminal domain-containing protein [Elusimicrobiales bacterium]
AKNGLPDVDLVLTTRELAGLIRTFGLDLKTIQPEEADLPFGDRSTAGKLFGASGGVMEAALRTAHHMLTGKELPSLKVEKVRGMQGVKEAALKIGSLELEVAAVSGLGNARQLLEQVRHGRHNLHFVEVMTCPGGCINGGGQPFAANKAAVQERMKALYSIDNAEEVRTAHSNKAVQELYRTFLGKPLGEKSHALLHTKYKAKAVSDRL